MPKIKILNKLENKIELFKIIIINNSLNNILLYCHKITKIKDLKILKENNANNKIIYKKKKEFIKKMKKSINYKIYYCFFNFILINLIYPILAEKVNNKYRKLNSQLTIYMKVTYGNKLKLVNSWFLPNRVYINGIKSKLDSSGHVNINNEEINNVTMEYDEKFTKFDRMFQNLDGIIEIDFSNLDTSSVTSMKNMFLNCINLKYINFNNIDTSSVNNMTSMFEGCYSLESVDLSNFNTLNVRFMDNMFKGCRSLTSLNLESFQTPNLYKIKQMFIGCELLKNIDLSSINTSLINDMESLFNGCISLTSINLKSLDTRNVKNMKGLFSLCSSLKSLDLSEFVTENVINMNNMFSYCDSLISLNLSNFITSNVEDMESMFSECFSLVSINLSSFITNKVKNMESMFSKCSSLKDLDLSEFNISNKKIKGLFYKCSSLTSIKFSKYNILKGNIDLMFAECTSLTSIDLSNFVFSSVNSMESLFYGCFTLISLDLSNTDASQVINMKNMFYGCESLKILNLTNYITFSIKNINSMFANCYSLISLNLNNFNTSLVEDMSNLFTNCIQLTSLNLSNFNTSLVIDMNSMFKGCHSLSLLDLSSFNTSLVKDMSKMFYSCYKLSSLDLSSFNTQNLLNLENMFYDCANLKYINFYNYSDGKILLFNDLLYGTDNGLIICINYGSNIKQLIHQLLSNQCIIRKCPIEIKEIKMKIIYDNKNCIEECFYDKIYKYEYNNVCYDNCPEGTHLSKDNKNNCEKNIFKCIEKFPFLIKEDNKCAKNCNCKDFFEDLCTINNINKESEEIIIKNIIKGIQEGLIDILLNQLLNGEKKEIIKKVNNTIYQITSSFNQNNKEYKNLSSIKLGECENILKGKYNIPKNDSLIIFKIEHFIEGLLIPIIEYEIFNPINKELLDLDYCKNEHIIIDVFISESINENDLYKYDPNSSYYNDICQLSKTEENIDLSLYDRKNEFNNNNLSLCSNICVYNGFNFTNKKAICNCNAQNSISFFSKSNNDELIFKFSAVKSLTNFNILKCYKIIFSKEGFTQNIGNYILLLIIFIYIVSAIFIYAKGYDSLCHQIDDIINSKIFENNIEPNFKREFKFNKKLKENSFEGSSMSKKSKKSIIKNNIFKSNDDSKVNSDSSINNNISNNIDNKQEQRKKNKIEVEYFDYEFNNMSYKEALEYDKRTFFQYYISLLKIKHILLFTFIQNKDYNSYVIKLCLFFFTFSLYLMINTLFFNDSMMHKIYENRGTFNYIYIIPTVIYSIIISSIIYSIVKKLSLSQDNILGIKNEKNKYNLKGRVITVIKCLIIKINSFFIGSFLFLIFFWYYISCFCSVYKKTQKFLIKNTLISYLIALIYPFIFYLLPGIFRIPALRRPGEYLYKLSQFFQLY